MHYQQALIPGTVESKSERGIPAPIPLARDMRRAVAMLDLESQGRSRSIWKTWSKCYVDLRLAFLGRGDDGVTAAFSLGSSISQ